jgi:cell wall-associated NlpC family hydrolase
MPDEMRIDSDGDGLSDAVERQLGTTVHKADSDGDGLSDGFEVAVGNQPRVRDLSVKDPAGSAAIVDDLVRGQEQLTGVTEHNVDSDGDGFADWVETMRGGTSTTAADLTASAVLPNPSPLDEFLNRAQSQAGVPYRFGAEADLDNPSGAEAFDSSELVQWAAHQAGVDLPDGSWMQYRSLALAGHSISVETAKATKGALLFGFSSDPMASTDRPARAFVGISLGDGKVLDVSERAGEVRELDAGGFYTHAATIPGIDPDVWEDTDGDGHPDFDEYLSGGDPTRGITTPWRDTANIDSDGDGIPDRFDPTPDGPDTPNAPSPSSEPQSQAPSAPEPEEADVSSAAFDPVDEAGSIDMDPSFAAPADDAVTAFDGAADAAFDDEGGDVGGFEA